MYKSMSCIYLYMCISSQSRSRHHLARCQWRWWQCQRLEIFVWECWGIWGPWTSWIFCSFCRSAQQQRSLPLAAVRNWHWHWLQKWQQNLQQHRLQIIEIGSGSGCKSWQRLQNDAQRLRSGCKSRQRLQNGARCRWTTCLSLVYPLISHNHLSPHVHQPRFPPHIVRHETKESVKTEGSLGGKCFCAGKQSWLRIEGSWPIPTQEGHYGKGKGMGIIWT